MRPNFKTSYVTVYPSSARRFFRSDSISKHRMLLFISIKKPKGEFVYIFQNIVCYCLSCRSAYSGSDYHHFKTSYVTVYPGTAFRPSVLTVISKHRMLLFITVGFSHNPYITIISKHRMLLFILSFGRHVIYQLYFKTSYVTVYLLPAQSSLFFTSFQNIVCYCLSTVKPFCPSVILYFKTSYVTVYRICSYSSSETRNDFKTSYVTVYPGLSGITKPYFSHFKTSYVTVYLLRKKRKTAKDKFQNIVCYCLSVNPLKAASVPVFQNIVCYCLSSRHVTGQILQRNFKTSYVTVYQSLQSCFAESESFQNIVCYCLS